MIKFKKEHDNINKNIEITSKIDSKDGNSNADKFLGLNRYDIGFTIIIILVAVIFLIVFGQFGKKSGSQVAVSVDGTVIGTYFLDENQTVTITGFEGGYNVLRIQDGKASIYDADCPDKLCVHQCAITNQGESLICLPHRVVVTVIGGEEGTLDAVTN